MGNHFVRINDDKSFAELTARSKERPQVIFKHSLTCPISAAAYDQMSRYAGEVALIEVQVARQLSNEVENRLGVPHESPQVIVLNKGQVAWNASHFKITAEAVTEAVKEATGRRAVGQTFLSVPFANRVKKIRQTGMPVLHRDDYYYRTTRAGH